MGPILFLSLCAVALANSDLCYNFDGYVPHEDCDKFFHCENGVANLFVCSFGFYFSDETNTCEVAENVVCLGEDNIWEVDVECVEDGNEETETPTEEPELDPEDECREPEEETEDNLEESTEIPEENVTEKSEEQPTEEPEEEPTEEPEKEQTNEPEKETTVEQSTTTSRTTTVKATTTTEPSITVKPITITTESSSTVEITTVTEQITTVEPIGTTVILSDEEKIEAICSSRPDSSFLTPHPSDCGKYGRCTKGKARVSSCEDGLHFSASTLYCTSVEAAQCSK